MTTLQPLATMPSTLFFEVGLSLGSTTLGKAVLNFRRGGNCVLDLTSRTGTFRYVAVGASATCLLVSGQQKWLFQNQPDGSAPAPAIRVDPVPEGGAYNLNLLLEWKTAGNWRPIDLYVHPGAGAHLADRLLQRAPTLIPASGSWELAGVGTESFRVSLSRLAGRINGCRADFPQEEGPPLRFEIASFTIDGALPVGDDSWVAAARKELPADSGLLSLVPGFYAVLKGFFP